MNAERGTDQVLERVGDARPVEVADETFEALYRQRYRDVYRYSLLMLRRAEDAEDVTSEAFHRAYSAWQSGRGPAGQALPWLLLIARRLVIDKMRRRRLISWLPLGGLSPAHEPSDQADTDRTEFWLWFDRFARELPDRQREVLILRYYRDLDNEAIAEILGLSTSGVRSLVARACATLRRNPEIWR
ncbi:MAG TPA: sigma-70 family RNA polymerase sigma factor [Candidatus Limnocylindrales bacterium]